MLCRHITPLTNHNFFTKNDFLAVVTEPELFEHIYSFNRFTQPLEVRF